MDGESFSTAAASAVSAAFAAVALAAAAVNVPLCVSGYMHQN